MGNRRNKKKKNLLKNSYAEDKPAMLSEQKDTKRVQQSVSKKVTNNQQVLSSKIIENESDRKSEPQMPNEAMHLKSCVSKFSSMKIVSDASEYEKKSSFERNKSQHISDMPEASKNYKSFNSNPRKNISLFEEPNLGHHLSNFSDDVSDTDDEYWSYDFSIPSSDNSVKSKNSCLVLCQKKSNKDNLFTSVNEYNSSKHFFSQLYRKWLPERKKTLTELQSLIEEVLSDQQQYNKTQYTCKKISADMRRAVIQSETVMGYFAASFAGFISDSVSGISSFSQAFCVDSYQTKFQEILDRDAEVTKKLYETRSRCVAEYDGIEEVMRKFHCDTFGSTMGKISNTLEVNKYWESMKNAYKNDDMDKLLNVVGNFFSNACQNEVLGEISNALDKYADDNPAALEACKSTGKAVYGAVNAYTPNINRIRPLREINCAANGYLMFEDIKDACHFESAANDDCQGSKLVMRIEEAKDSLQSELEEMEAIYLDLFKNESSCRKYLY